MPPAPPTKRNPAAEEEALEWIEAVLGVSFDRAIPIEHHLKNGVVLCNLINVLAPGSVKKIAEKGTDFKLMENITNFDAAIKKYGVSDRECFQTVDLWKATGMAAVTNTLHALGAQAQKKGFTGPALGVKRSEAQKREWTEEQLKAGQSIPSLQMGFTGGASQAGMNIGNARHIVD